MCCEKDSQTFKRFPTVSFRWVPSWFWPSKNRYRFCFAFVFLSEFSCCDTIFFDQSSSKTVLLHRWFYWIFGTFSVLSKRLIVSLDFQVFWHTNCTGYVNFVLNFRNFPVYGNFWTGIGFGLIVSFYLLLIVCFVN